MKFAKPTKEQQSVFEEELVQMLEVFANDRRLNLAHVTAMLFAITEANRDADEFDHGEFDEWISEYHKRGVKEKCAAAREEAAQ
jgi:hypothetical protein